MTTIIKIPFTFSTDVKLARSRQAKRLTLLTETEVLVEEIAAADAPVALWWTCPQIAANYQVAVRSFNGALWHPVIYGEDENVAAPPAEGFLRQVVLESPPDDNVTERYGAHKVLNHPTLLSKAAFLAVLAESRNLSNFQRIRLNAPAEPDWRDANVQRLNELSIKEIDNTPLKEQCAAIAKFAEGIALIDGVAHRRIAQPLIAMTMGVYPNLEFTFADSWESEPELLHQINEFDTVAAKIEELADWRNIRENVAAPEIVRPDLLDLDDPLKSATKRTAERVVSDQEGINNAGYERTSVISRHSLDVILAWMNVRDAVAANAPTQELLDKLKAFRTAADGVGMLMNLSEKIDRLLERWTTMEPASAPGESL